MAGESIFADGLDPTILDGDAGIKTIGNRFTVSEERPAVAGRIYVRPGGLPATALWQLWNENTATKLAELNMNAELSSPVTGQFSDWVTLASPVILSPGVSYLVAQHLSGSPGYEFTDGVPATFPVGTAPLSATTGVYQNGGGPSAMPSSVYAAYFFADLQLGDVEDPAEGTASLGITLSLAAAGQSDHDGAAAQTVTLTLAATGGTGHSGTAAAQIGLALAATGQRQSAATAAAGITLTLNAVGSNSSGVTIRPSSGSTSRPDTGLTTRP